MTTLVHNYKNFDKLPGTNHGHIYEFPTLYSIDTLERVRLWRIFVMLVPFNEHRYEIDWDPDEEEYYTIKPEYFNNATKIGPKIMALVFNEQGITNMKMTRNAPTKILEGSSGLKGRANERNTFTQALIYAVGEYNKRINNGYTRDIKVTKTDKNLYYAMSAKKYDDEIHKITFPCYSQPKLDGVRCLMTRKGSRVIKYSRDQKEWPNFDEFDEILAPIFDEWPTIVLDGELYKHGKRLQQIVGVARNETKSMDLDYCIFDMFLPNVPDLTFRERLEYLDDINMTIKSPRIIIVETKLVNSFTEIDKLYNSYIKRGYEGQMIRIAESHYAISKNREVRSGNILKRKKKFSDEFEFVRAIAAEKGRAMGTFIGEFKTKNNKLFRATPKGMTIPEMREFYNLVHSDIKNYVGKMATIEYEEVSSEEIPLRTKFVTFREGRE